MHTERFAVTAVTHILLPLAPKQAKSKHAHFKTAKFNQIFCSKMMAGEKVHVNKAYLGE